MASKGPAARSLDVRFVVDRGSAEASYRSVTFRSLERLARSAGLDDADLASFLGVSRKTLDRRARKGALEAAESMKAEMLSNILREARRILGDEGKARRWLTGPIASLDGRRPIDHLDSIEGYERVRETLTKIEYGMY
jgi:putative toxin-antitoxin system antitoxin component (TIGR02293 family)